MSVETDTIIEKINRTRNVTNQRGKLIEKQTRFLTFRERRAREEEKEWIDKRLNEEPWALKDVTADQRANLIRRRNHLEEDLEDNSPPEISGATKDALAKYADQLREEWQSGMPTKEVMRRNPAGAVDLHSRWEGANKGKIRQWKNILRVLEPDNDEKDYTNVERFRPSGLSAEDAASFMMSGQIPGSFAMTPLAKANWPLGEPKVDTPLKQAERQDMAEELAKDAGITDPVEIDALKARIKALEQQVAAGEIRAATKQRRKPGRPKKRTEPVVPLTTA